MKYNTKILINENKDFYILADKISKVITPELLNDLKKKISSQNFKKEIYNKTKNETVLKSIFSINIFNEIDDKLKKDIIEFAVSDMLLKTVTNYLGVFPIIRGIYLNVNFPT